MKLTVAICTWNRAGLLDQTLTALAGLTIPAGASWELVVVDNNSTDRTAEILARHAARLPLARVFEPVPGHCQARNAALARATGDLVVWTDDDVLVDADWLVRYHAAAERWPEAAFFGGTVDPLYAATPPRWVEANLDLLAGAYALARFGVEERPLAPGELPFGANMAMRPAALGGLKFDTRLGLKQNDHVRGDETELFRRLVAAGHSGIWVGSARVRHHVPAARLTSRYVWDYNVGYGRTMARLERAAGSNQSQGVPRWMIRKASQRWLVAALKRGVGRLDWVLPYVESARLIGQMAERRAAVPVTTTSPQTAREQWEAACR